uniref:Uncharacterized protein KIAA0195-like n=1 Tax=Phallusia mammillata TaxID=59560 RepID=A0A6F9DFQ5_9ASCI|nr:uncharacterized protein KIAA0195-like [Phallusia mammillata]
MELSEQQDSLEVIRNEIKGLQAKYKQVGIFQIFKEGFCTNSLLPWSVVILALICIIVLFVDSTLHNNGSDFIVGSILLVLLLMNTFTSICDVLMTRRETYQRLKCLSESTSDSNNTVEEYISFVQSLEHPSILSGPSHSFTPVYKKLEGAEQLVSYPTALIATGDIISLCVGQRSPCQAVCIEDSLIVLKKEEILTEGDLQNLLNDQTDFRLRFKVKKSPIIQELENSLLDKDGKPKLTFNRLRRKSMLVRRRERITHLILVVLIPCLFIVSSLSGIFWYIFQTHRGLIFTDYNKTQVCAPLFLDWSADIYWFETFVFTPVLTLLPLLPIMCPILWLLLYGIGEARTLSPCVSSKQRNGKRETLPHSATAHSMSQAQLQSNEQVQTYDYSWVQLLPYTLFSHKKLLSRNAGAFDNLGSLTVLCCINKEGLLSWIDPYPEKVFFINTNDAQDSTNTFGDSNEDTEINPMPKVDVNREEANMSTEAHAEVLTLSQDTQNSSKLHFDETDWQNHLSSLKAICLNILVTHPSLGIDKILFPIATSNWEEAILSNISKLLMELKDTDKKGQDPTLCQETLQEHQKNILEIATLKGVYGPGTASTKTGLQSLAELTGFKNEVSLLYMPKRVITLYTKHGVKRSTSSARVTHLSQASESYLPHVYGVVVSQLSRQHHLLVAGSADLVTQLCGYYWDGKDIRPYDDTMQVKTTDFYNRSAAVGHCVAFSCIPVSKQFAERESLIKEIDSDTVCSDDLPGNQIFLGMVSLQYQSRLPVFHMVEALESACIRFVHFTHEDEVRSRVFAEKMGVEVGWNCHISLSACHPSHTSQHASTSHVCTGTAESDDEVDQETELLQQKFSSSPTSESTISESAFHALNRAKLPRGIDNIVPHIENVDNVPLLVPLFTDCQKESMCEMIEIMQKYGEVVCCIGSADSIHNFPVFAQANVGIAMEPVLRSSDENDENRGIDRNVSFNSRVRFGSTSFHNTSTLDSVSEPVSKGGEIGVMKIARSLNSFPCTVALSGDDSLAVVYNMIKQARHFLFLVQVSLVFYIKCLSVTSLTQVTCHLVHLPLMFSSTDLLWLCNIILPVLSFSILGSPSDPDLMSWASIKNTRRQVFNAQLIRQNVSHFCIKFLPSCLIVLLLYALGIQSSCLQLQNENDRKTSNTTSHLSVEDTHTQTSVITCYPFYDVTITSQGHISDTVELQREMTIMRRDVQQVAMFAFVLYISIISVGYVHRWRLITKHSPFTNKLWLFTLLIILVIQVVYSTSVVFVQRSYTEATSQVMSLGPYQVAVWVVLFAWPLPCLACNELIKWREIRLWNRSQKRARLEFGTKLGMNSPF